MKKIIVADSGKSIPILVEEEAYEGVKRIANKSADDVGLVTGIRPDVLCGSVMEQKEDAILFFATIGKSRLIDELASSGRINLDTIRGRREVFGIYLVENPWDGIEKALIICGSDKRGTIYGIFHLSERIGVSPLIFWGDARPTHCDFIEFDESVEMVSKEPSVQYRGFFINDEWPCFGNWCMNHFGGFNAGMYDCVFELLLRLKGNYLWPAMWTSSFHLDGPGEKNAELADIYGIIMGTSHHEPCSRASEEWDLVKSDKSLYGTAWDYTINKEGLLEYWKDGLLRSNLYENIITVGMRGERDSEMQGNKTLSENIAVLKDIISSQDKLIKRFSDHNDIKSLRLLAVYKEVEQYFYGSKDVEGLRDWEGLKDIILMLCEDNYGYMRFLPDEVMQDHIAGYGMYYHLDYHGGPVSYEWINTTPLSKIWEQMTEAYEFGIKKVWMVNVGDLKGNEFPLSFFMTLAYDYETWGINEENSAEKYTNAWVRKQLGTAVDEEMIRETASLLTEGVRLCSLQKPEALHADTFHPFYFDEADRMIAQVSDVLQRMENLRQKLPAISKAAFYSTIGHPLQSGMNLLLMHLYAGKNAHYAKQGKKVANRYRDLVEEAIQKDKELAEEFGNAFYQKWKGMELGTHIGFTKWNEDRCRYPVRMTVEPFSRPRMIVSRSSQCEVASKNYGKPDCIVISDFLYEGIDVAFVEIANDGNGSFTCCIEQEPCNWIYVSWSQKVIEEQEILCITCNRELLTKSEQIHRICLVSEDTRIELEIHARRIKTDSLPKFTYLEQNGRFVIKAEHYAKLQTAGESGWRVIPKYGKAGCGLKAFPVTKEYRRGEGPAAMYRLFTEDAGEYLLEIWSAPTNPLKQGGRLRFGIGINEESIRVCASVSDNYQAGDPSNAEWCEGVINQIRKYSMKVRLKPGLNEITILAMEAGFILEEIILSRMEVPKSCLGPQESSYL